MVEVADDDQARARKIGALLKAPYVLFVLSYDEDEEDVNVKCTSNFPDKETVLRWVSLWLVAQRP